MFVLASCQTLFATRFDMLLRQQNVSLECARLTIHEFDIYGANFTLPTLILWLANDKLQPKKFSLFIHFFHIFLLLHRSIKFHFFTGWFFLTFKEYLAWLYSSCKTRLTKHFLLLSERDYNVFVEIKRKFSLICSEITSQ